MRARSAVPLAFSAFGALAVALAPGASANGTQTWSLSVASGNGSGGMSSNLPDHYWHVAGFVSDNKAGDDCTYVKVSVPTLVLSDVGSRWGDVEKYRLQACGATLKRFDWHGTTPGGSKDYVVVAICQNRTLHTDPCSSKKLFET